MSEEHLNALCAWVDSLQVQAFVKVGFYADAKERWTVRICTPANGGIAHPLRTLSGHLLEDVCAKLLPLAQNIWSQQSTSQIRKYKEFKQMERKNRGRLQREITADIEAMHHSASDF